MTDEKVVRVFSTPTCPYCMKVKELLDELGVQHKDINVAEDDAALQEMMEKSGQQGVPVSDIGGEYITGFDKDKIVAALKAKGFISG